MSITNNTRKIKPNIDYLALFFYTQPTMNTQKQQLLMAKAVRYMKQSRDPIHDLGHVTRVVAHANQLAKVYQLSADQTNALILAAWWHDVARSITKRPSIIIMPFIDDIISAFMLWHATIKYGLFGPVVGMATRMIFCKSIGTGRIFTKLLMRKKNHILVNILEDADRLDILYIGRTEQLFMLADSSRLYHFGYRLTIWWFLSTKSLHMKTEAATKELISMVESFNRWMKQHDIMSWHRERFGEKWMNEQFIKVDQLIQTLEKQLLTYSFSQQ